MLQNAKIKTYQEDEKIELIVEESERSEEEVGPERSVSFPQKARTCVMRGRVFCEAWSANQDT